MKNAEAAMTLLEVMAAVAIVGLVFTSLARVASQGLQSEGTSRRRFEASLLADSVLADIEDGIATGVTPELGTTESASDDEFYTVFVDVTPFDLAAAIPTAAEAAAATAGLALAPSIILGSGSPGGEFDTPVRQIEITVAWNEGVDERSVFRTTYGLDMAAIQDVLGSAAQNLEPTVTDPTGASVPTGASDPMRSSDANRAPGVTP